MGLLIIAIAMPINKFTLLYKDDSVTDNMPSSKLWI